MTSGGESENLLSPILFGHLPSVHWPHQSRVFINKKYERVLRVDSAISFVINEGGYESLNEGIRNVYQNPFLFSDLIITPNGVNVKGLLIIFSPSSPLSVSFLHLVLTEVLLQFGIHNPKLVSHIHLRIKG